MSPRAIAIAGPTASGKSAAALALARQMPLEIISVDSAQVYRGLDIGTAKPSPAERAAVPHHLIDILDPSERYSAAAFVRDAGRLIGEINARGRLALLVGGTLLYFKALFDGLDELPGANPALRAEIDAQARRDGWPALHAELARVDPLTAARLAPGDSQRIQRALEVFRASGRPISSLHTGHTERSRTPPAGGMPLIALEPADRGWLHRRIAERLHHMLAAGLLEEVRALRGRADLHADLPAMRCVGYRQSWELLDGAWPPGQLAERCIAATRQLAKRQLTWLRGMPQRHVVACDAADATAEVLRLAASLTDTGR